MINESRNRIKKRFCKFRKQNVTVEIKLETEHGNKNIVQEHVNKCLSKQGDCESFGCEYAVEGLGAQGKDPF